MNRRSILLPHRYQVYGWRILGLWLALFCLLVLPLRYLRITNGTMIDLGGVGHFINLLFFTCLPFLALMLICLSQEKEEDEYIQHLRSVTVFSIVVILFCASLITASSQMMLSFYGLGSVHYYLNWWCQYLSQMPVLAIIYIIVFKSLLFAQKIKSRRDE